MSVFKDSYRTTLGSAFATKNIENAIRECIVVDYLNQVSLNVNADLDVKPIYLTGVKSSESTIPLFAHPLLVTHDKQEYLVTDIRLFIRKDTPFNSIESGIKNITEFNFIKGRSILNLAWVNQGVNRIKIDFLFANTVFSAWLSDVISNSFALDFKDRTVVNIIASLYYQRLFTDSKEISEEDKQRLTVHTINATGAPHDMVFNVIDRIKDLNNIEDFCTAVKTITENIRLEKFNFAVLTTLIKSSWYGINAKEIISVSIEHPPTWTAMLYTVLHERTYKNSSIYRIAEKSNKKGSVETFVKSFSQLIKDFTIEDKYDIRNFDTSN